MNVAHRFPRLAYRRWSLLRRYAALTIGLLLAQPSIAQNPTAALPSGRSADPSGRLTSTAERPRVPAGLALSCGPLALLDPAVDLDPTVLRRLAASEATAAARAEVVKQLEAFTRRPHLLNWCLTDVSVSAQRQPRLGEVQRLGEDPVLAAWMADDPRRVTRGLGRLSPVGDWSASDSILVRAELEVGPLTPLTPPMAHFRQAEPYRTQFAGLLETRQSSLSAVVTASRIRVVALLCECELDRSLPGVANQTQVAAITEQASTFLEHHLRGAGLRIVRVKRANLTDPDDRLREEAGRVGADSLLLVRFRELEGLSQGTRCKSAGLVELAFYGFDPEQFQKPRRDVLGTAAQPFGTRDTLDKPSLAADGFVQTAASHLVAEGRILQVFSELLIAQWKADARRD